MHLSGGNQQKVLLARWLMRDLRFFLVDEPTRGVDVKSQAEIYALLWRLRDAGKGLLVSSPDLPELLVLCDRILVMHEGHIETELHRGEPGFDERGLLEALHAGGTDLRNLEAQA